MNMNDEKIELPFDVSKEQLEQIAKETGTLIETKGGIIVIEGDQADVDEAAKMISESEKVEHFDDPIQDDPYESLEEGQRYSDKTVELPDDYTVYDLISFDDKTGLWHCKTTTYYFKHHPYRHAYTEHDDMDVPPKALIQMKKINKRK